MLAFGGACGNPCLILIFSEVSLVCPCLVLVEGRAIVVSLLVTLAACRCALVHSSFTICSKRLIASFLRKIVGVVRLGVCHFGRA